MNFSNELFDGITPVATSYISDPQHAWRFAFAGYITFGFLCVLGWDIIINLERDYRPVRNHGISLMFVVYFISRISTLCFMLMKSLTFIVPISHCGAYFTGLSVTFNIVFASTMLLSYCLVCSIWRMQKSIILLFGAVWLLGVAGASTTLIGVYGKPLLDSPYCSMSVTKGVVIMAIVGPTLHHVATLVAITYGICRGAPGVEISRRNRLVVMWRRYVKGEGLPTFSKTVLRASQICYMIAMLSGIVEAYWFYQYRSDSNYKFAVIPACVVTLNISFGRVFRQTRLGVVTNGRVFSVAPPASNYNQTAIIELSTMNLDIDIGEVLKTDSESASHSASNVMLESGVSVSDQKIGIAEVEKRDVICNAV